MNILISSRCQDVLFGGIAQLARASALQAEGRRFDSDYLHKKKTSIRASFFVEKGLPPVRLCLTAPVGHTEPLITVRASPRLHCIPSLQRYGLSRIALCARIPVDYLCKLDAQKNELKFPTPVRLCLTATFSHQHITRLCFLVPRHP